MPDIAPFAKVNGKNWKIPATEADNLMESSLNQEQKGKGVSKTFFLFSLAFAVFFFILDQVTKELVVRLMTLGDRKVIIAGFFNLTSVRNNGAAWNMFAGKQWFLLLVSFAVMAGIIFFFKKLTCNYRERVFAILLLCSGIVGNCVDRLFRNEVVDFLEFHLGRFYWPSFNVADSCICVGVFLFVISSLIRPEPEEEKKDKK
ncbi:MAG: signal peptidase II [Lentisphaeria bacterium]|nr:signal peptidase II [Lentisphaeria bacterium]